MIGFAPAFVPRASSALSADSKWGKESDAAYNAIIATGKFDLSFF